MILWILYMLFILVGIFKFPDLTLALVLLNSGYTIIAVVAFLTIYVPGFKTKGRVYIDRQWRKFTDLLK